MAESARARIMVCRSGLEPLAAGSELGYSCAICRKPLQVTSEGLMQIKIHSVVTLCNACGLDFAERLINQPPEGGTSLVFHTAAQEHMARHGLRPEDFISKKPVQIESHCPLCDAPHTALEGSRVDCRCGMSYMVTKG